MRCAFAAATAATAAAARAPYLLGISPGGVLSASTAVRRYTTTTTVLLETSGVCYSRLGMDGFTNAAYNAAADAFLERIDKVLDEVDNEAIEDVSLLSGVLSIETKSGGTFILNKQAPNVQLWLSSPVSGPHHYDMVVPAEGSREASALAEKPDEVQWLSDGDGHSLKEKLERELTDTLGVDVRL